jgi:hypothetical protein
VQHVQQQAYSVQNPAALKYVDPLQMQAFVNYVNSLDYNPADAAEMADILSNTHMVLISLQHMRHVGVTQCRAITMAHP